LQLVAMQVVVCYCWVCDEWSGCTISCSWRYCNLQHSFR